jgi:hypothetical protein
MVIDDATDANVRDLELELAWLGRVIDLRLRLHFPADAGELERRTIADLPPPPLDGSSSAWAAFVRGHELGHHERLAVVLALVPHLRPQLLDVFFTKNAATDRRFTEFGGARTDDDLEPTGEMLAFLLGGGSLESRMEVARLIEPANRLSEAGVLRVAPQHSDQPLMKAPLRVAPDFFMLVTTGRRSRPTLGVDFPAQRVETALEWSDLVLHPGTLRQIEEIQSFILHGDTLMRGWDMGARLRPGHRALFHGPPGTGKSMSVALLGKVTRRDVYRIDLSLVVSKYIGETEKNLARLFDRAQDWILFFDEADALFGKRSEARDAHDRYANQEVAYLLQRIESFGGIAILASNLRQNLDDAFMRRFESVVYFPLPRPEERLRLWTRGFSSRARLKDVDLARIASDHELTGGSIMNVIRYVSLAAIADGEREITRDDLLAGIRRELAKEGRA